MGNETPLRLCSAPCIHRSLSLEEVAVVFCQLSFSALSRRLAHCNSMSGYRGWTGISFTLPQPSLMGSKSKALQVERSLEVDLKKG